MGNRREETGITFFGNETIRHDLLLILLLMHLWETVLIIAPASCDGNTYISFPAEVNLDLLINTFSSYTALDFVVGVLKILIMKELPFQAMF